MSEDRPGFWVAIGRRPLIGELVASGLLFALILWTTSNAGYDFAPLILILLATLLLGGLWCLHWLVGLVVRARGTLRKPLTAGEWIAWAVLPVLLFGGYAQARLRLTLRTRFALSRSAFEEFDRTAQEGNPAPERLGLYSVENVYYEAGRPHIATATPGLFSHSGFVRWPERPPRETSAYWYRHLTGRWYVYYWSD